MRLLEFNNDGEFSLTQDIIDDIPRYAILSHTWGVEEVTFRDMIDGTGKSKAGYDKIRFCGEMAQRHCWQYFWVDTCCIDKSNNTELSEAINSMFRWYKNSAKCYVYLSDVLRAAVDTNIQTNKLDWEAFRHSRWFTRGWTLQELIAPTLVEFFSKDWEQLGDKVSLEQHICEITSIPAEVLRGSSLSDFSITERMSWAERRETTRKEDQAYSLLGIFDVYMPLLYGEGKEHAFKRLQKMINENSKGGGPPPLLPSLNARAEDFLIEEESRYIQAKQQKRRTIWRVVLLVLIVAAVVAAVVGGVLSSKSKSNSSSSTTASEHNIAAISFVSSNINQTRVYYQDNTGILIEAVTTANSSTWTNKALDYSAVNGSAIAAAVSRYGYPLEISVFYTDYNHLIHDVYYNFSASAWQSGVISAQGYTTLSNSSITAMYNQCALCGNTILVAYQDSNGFIQVANKTAKGWVLTQVGLEVTQGTGLALHPFFRIDQADQINLYHQKSYLNLSLASYNDPQSDGGLYGWSTSEQIYEEAVYGTPIAAASSYQNVTTGYDLWIELLSINSRGIQVGTWSGNANNWLSYDEQPTAMAYSITDEVNYGAVAMTVMGTAYAVVRYDNGTESIRSWQLADDFTDWSEVGDVDIGSAWV